MWLRCLARKQQSTTMVWCRQGKVHERPKDWHLLKGSLDHPRGRTWWSNIEMWHVMHSTRPLECQSPAQSPWPNHVRRREIWDLKQNDFEFGTSEFSIYLAFKGCIGKRCIALQGKRCKESVSSFSPSKFCSGQVMVPMLCLNRLHRHCHLSLSHFVWTCSGTSLNVAPWGTWFVA